MTEIKCTRCTEVLQATQQIRDALTFFNMNQDEKNRIYSPILTLDKIIKDIQSDAKEKIK